MKSEVFERVYVDVKAAFNSAGKLMPLELTKNHANGIFLYKAKKALKA